MRLGTALSPSRIGGRTFDAVTFVATRGQTPTTMTEAVDLGSGFAYVTHAAPMGRRVVFAGTGRVKFRVGGVLRELPESGGGMVDAFLGVMTTDESCLP